VTSRCPIVTRPAPQGGRVFVHLRRGAALSLVSRRQACDMLGSKVTGSLRAVGNIRTEEGRLTMTEEKAALVKALNVALGAEYGALWMLPQHMAQVQDPELKRQLQLIADVELEHAEKTARMIYQLGGEPNADLPQLRVRRNVKEIVEAHIAAERDAIQIYDRALKLTVDPEMKKVLATLKQEEEGHQRLLERALARL
jgi:rubrerythrin